MDEATLGAKSRMSKRVGVPVTSRYYYSYWKSLVCHHFISKIKKSHIVEIASPFFLWH
jgi:hypothetical protein